MNILHIANIRNRPQSGVVAVVPKHVKHQARHANVALLNLDDFTPLDFQSNSSQLFNLSKYPKGIASLPKPFNKPDLVIFHEIYWPAFLKIAKHCKTQDIPYIVTPHGSLTDIAQRRKRLKKLAGNLLAFNKFVDNARAIHFLSESERSQTSRFTDKDYFIQNNGIETHPHLKKNFNKDKLRLIYIGRLEYKIKGIDRILNAVNIAQNEMRKTDIKVIIHGPAQDGADKKIDNAIHNYGISDLVTVGEGLFGEEKIKTIVSNDCFIQLSRAEGQPLGIMEAMDLGMPCIVTRGTTFYEIGKSHGANIPVDDDPESIADMIISIRERPDMLVAISAKASKYIKSHYSWSMTAPATIENYKRIIGYKRDC